MTTGRKTSGKNNLQPHHDWTSAYTCDNIGEANVDCGGFYLMEAMILMYWRALCAASLCALLQERPVPWHTVTGEVDSSARHWYWPFTVSSSVKYSHTRHSMNQPAKMNSGFHSANYLPSRSPACNPEIRSAIIGDVLIPLTYSS